MREAQPVKIDAAPGSRPDQVCGTYKAWDMPLTGAIDRIWYSHSGTAGGAHQLLLPFAEPSLVLRRRMDAQGRTASFDIAISPACHDGGSYVAEANEELFAVRVAPERLERLLDLHPRDLAGERVPVPAALRAKLDGVLVMAGRDSFREAWAQLARVLGSLEVARADASLDHASLAVRRAAGRLGPSRLAELCDISPRQLRRGFAERYGLSPRALARRLRLTAALIEADGQARPRWAEIATGHGYCDQAHLVRECRSIMGATPVTLHACRRTMAVSFKN